MKFLRLLVYPLNIGTSKIVGAIRNFPITEKALFFSAISIFVISGGLLIFNANTSWQIEIPTHGGTLREGIVGTPRFINPILAISDADRDLTSLVYAGLTKASPEGEYIPDLAESYRISEDGTIYTFTLKDNLTFHNGEPITTADLAFTIRMAQDPLLKSPKRVNWDGVAVNVLSDKEIQFILNDPFVPFIENTTLGILPEHIWNNITTDQFQFSQFNIDPIGSGPYKISSIRYNSGGLPIYYELSPFKKYALGEPFIDRIVIRLYQNDSELVKAFNENDIDSLSSFSKEKFESLDLSESDEVIKSSLPRIFGLFFNQNESPVLLNKEVREALNIATDRQDIVAKVFGVFAEVTDSPIPNLLETAIITSSDLAKKTLEEEGWSINEETNIYEREIDDGIERLSLSISTSNIPELVETAELLKEQWQNIGADVQVKIFETNDLNQNVIRPRNFEVLLFGLVLGRNTDLYSFWHSSNRNDPGLNVAQYTNITVDKIVEDVRVTSDSAQRQDLFSSFIKELKSDIPAVFVYSPFFTYVLPEKVHYTPIGNVVLPSDRFNSVHEWYIETYKVWKIFID